MKKILITGASGFIGSKLVEEAIKNEMNTYAAIRKSSNRDLLKDKRIHLIEIDFEDSDSIRQILKTHQFDYIIHTAGTTKARSSDEYMQVNCNYLKNLVEAIKQEAHSLQKFIFISSLAAYGPSEYHNNGLISQSGKPHPITDYGRSKLAAEEYLHRQEIPYIILRPTAVYGPGDTAFLTVYRLVKRGIEIYFGNNTQKLSFIYIHDLVEVVFKCFNSPSKSSYFVSDGKVYTLKEFYANIKEAFGVKTLKIKIPLYVLKSFFTVNTWIHQQFNTYTILNTDRLHEFKAEGWICDSTDLQNKLEFHPNYSLKQGLLETIEWYNSSCKYKI